MLVVAERKRDAQMAEAALAQIEAAYAATQSGGHGPYANYYKAEATKASALVGRLTAP